MQNNNLIDLKKAQAAKKEKTAEEAEYSAKLEFLRSEKQEKMRAQKAALLAEENEANQNNEVNEAINKNDISSGDSFSEPNTFWSKLGKSFLYILIFLLPLFFLPTTIYPIDANKQFLAVFLVAASLFCYLANCYFTERIIYSKSMLIFAAVFFVIAGGISAFFSISPNNSLFGDFSQADVFINFVIYGLALYLSAVLFKKEDFSKIGIIFLSSTALISILSLLQLFGLYIFPFDFAKQIGFNVFGSVINFDIFIAFGLVLIVSALIELKIPLKFKAVLIFVGLLIALNIFFINYQPIWILMAMIMVMYAIYKFIFRPEGGAVSSISSGAPLLIGIIAFLFALVGPSLPKTMKMPNLPVDVKPNFSATINVSKNVLSGFRILTGTGLATFASQYNFYRPVELNQSVFWRLKFNQGFSFAATYLTTSGVIGVLSVLFIIFSFARLAVKNIEDKKSMVVSIGLLFIIMSWFYFPAYFVGFIFSFIALGVLAALDSRPEEFELSRAMKSRAIIGIIILLALTAGSISLLYFSGKKYVAALYFQKGLKEYSLNNMDKSSENISKAISLDQGNDQYMRSASQFMIIDAQNSRDPKIELNKDSKFQSKIANAVSYAKGATEVNPADSGNWYNLGDIYEKIINIAGGADSFAESSYSKSSELNPKNPDSLIGRARVLMFTARQSKDSKIKEEKIAAAIDSLEKAVNLKFDYAASHFQLGLAYMEVQRKDDAIKEFELTKTLSDSDAPINFQLGMLYYNNNDFDKAKTELEAAISLDPNFSNARYILGLVFDKKGLKDSAISQFENILKLNPDSVEVKDILNNLKTKGSAFIADKPVSSETINESLNLPQPDQGENIDIGINESMIVKP